MSDLEDGVRLTLFLLLVSSAIFLIPYWVVCLLPDGWPIAARQRKMILAGFLGGLPLGFTGIVSGFLTGSSRSPAVAALIPAILTFVGLLVVYMIGKGRLRAIISGFVVFVFSIDLLVGTVLGTESRNRYEEYVGSIGYQKQLAEREWAIRRYRSALHLPLDAPKPTPAASPSDKP